MSDTAAETAVARLSPDARRLLWILTRALPPVPETLVEKVFARESVEDERFRQIGRMIDAFERMPPASRPEMPAMPDEVKQRIAALREAGEPERPDLEPLVGELVEARLVSRAPLLEGGAAMGLEATEAAALAVTAWMEARPEERAGQDEAQVLIAFGERYGAAFVASVEGKVPGGTKEAGIEAGITATSYFLAAGAPAALAAMFGEAVRAANDASIVGPVAGAVEEKGGLDVLLGAFDAQNDALGHAGMLAALAGYHKDAGDLGKAIALEMRALAPLARLDNVVPRAIVHLRVSELMEVAARRDESAAHLVAAILYRALSGLEFRAEIRVLVQRLGRDRGYTLPVVAALLEDPSFADLARFVRAKGVPALDVQADLDALTTQLKQHIGA
ncbi:hypothetical protein [Polyangium sp. y55x31]|uniref:hypothetical protein n=1 Tax=Polyangium sp. y55x31 TaxID=3042688 RepID=UPI002482F97A|nr:hypothetical protein [Polyangium sp. y55x31]MDI1481147.1 hypothetical protein [Polyangium sp. y55x31]